MRNILDRKEKKGAATGRLVGMVVIILMIAVLGGIIFGEDGLANTNLTGNAPAWVVTLLTVGAGIGLVRLILR